MPTQIDVAELGGLVGEGIVYGELASSITRLIHTCSRVPSLDDDRHRWKRNEPVPWPIPVLAVLMFFLATTQIIVDTLNVFFAFVDHATRAERIAFLMDSTQSIFAWKFSTVTTMIFFADCLVHYRCYVIWKSFWIVLLPFLTSVGSFVCGFVIIGATRNHALLSFESQQSLITAVFATSLAANAISTTLLTYKLVQHDRATRRALHVSHSAVTPIIRIVVESGAMSATWHVIFAITLETKSNGLQTVAEMATSMFALISTLVIIRAQLNADRGRSNTSRLLSASDFRASRSVPAPPQVSINMGNVHVVPKHPEDWKSEAIDMV
ncbi:hypothetical protein EVG20_g6943 [Dentipellis fragilis]|uniref:Transmembrane protein n=1 Tax=Dentipellis fragilis TaxID=205917 RepID=A0A4Y9YJW5_9AGAM|nr:hypothetical protein EVG20_g6943 [Dentipellis fragilis]